MDISSIASISTDMHMAQTQQAVELSVMKKAMNFESSQALALVESIPAPAPSFGHQLDVTV